MTRYEVLREEVVVDKWVKHSRVFVSHRKTEKSVLVFIYETYRTTSSVCNDTTYLCILCHEWIELTLVRTMTFSESKSFIFGT